MNPTLVMMCCNGSSGMMVTSGLTPNGLQSYNPYVPSTTELARQMYLSWQWPKAVNKLGILNIPCPPAPDHLRIWMFKVDDLSHLKLMPNHYLCVQYTRPLQFVAATTTNVVMCWPGESLTVFIMSMSPFYTITEDMW